LPSFKLIGYKIYRLNVILSYVVAWVVNLTEEILVSRTGDLGSDHAKNKV
jgi:hypothetical protein